MLRSSQFTFSIKLIALAMLFTSYGCSYQKITRASNVPPPSAWTQACTDWDGWDKPAPPFQIFGNTYYVGTCGISAILVTDKSGHILIDGATQAGADVIVANIESLGFSIKDIKVLLNTHEHFDHAAGLAKLQKLSGAKLLASPKSAPVLKTGVVSISDPQAGMHDPFEPVEVDGILGDYQDVEHGNLSLTPIFTPGHTPGAVSWQWESCDGEKCASIVFADSLSAVSSDDYRFSEHPIYIASFKRSFDKISQLNCDILISTHPSSSAMRDRLIKQGNLFQADGCVSYAEKVSTMLTKRLKREQN